MSREHSRIYKFVCTVLISLSPRYKFDCFVCKKLTVVPWCVYVPAAYKEKMKELSVLSLICSCFYPEMRNKLEHEFEGRDQLKYWFSLPFTLYPPSTDYK